MSDVELLVHDHSPEAQERPGMYGHREPTVEEVIEWLGRELSIPTDEIRFGLGLEVVSDE